MEREGRGALLCRPHAQGKVGVQKGTHSHTRDKHTAHKPAAHRDCHKVSQSLP